MERLVPETLDWAAANPNQGNFYKIGKAGKEDIGVIRDFRCAPASGASNFYRKMAKIAKNTPNQGNFYKEIGEVGE